MMCGKKTELSGLCSLNSGELGFGDGEGLEVHVRDGCHCLSKQVLNLAALNNGSLLGELHNFAAAGPARPGAGRPLR